MSTIHSFAPIENENAKVLILGSMPGVASLRAAQYYAHPRNLFWRMMAELIALDTGSDYEQRTLALKAARIAVWDVLHSCTRAGSLDSKIDKATQTPNDFQSFFAGHSNITHVYFNGSAAEQIFRRAVLPDLKLPHIAYLRLPSTSPANASISFERKVAAWKSVLQRD